MDFVDGERNILCWALLAFKLVGLFIGLPQLFSFFNLFSVKKTAISGLLAQYPLNHNYFHCYSNSDIILILLQ